MSSEQPPKHREGVDLEFICLDVPNASAHAETNKCKTKAMILAFKTAVALSSEVGSARFGILPSSKKKTKTPSSCSSHAALLKSAMKHKHYVIPATTITGSFMLDAIGVGLREATGLVLDAVMSATAASTSASSTGQHVSFSLSHATDLETGDVVQPSGRPRKQWLRTRKEDRIMMKWLESEDWFAG